MWGSQGRLAWIYWSSVSTAWISCPVGRSPLLVSKPIARPCYFSVDGKRYHVGRKLTCYQCLLSFISECFKRVRIPPPRRGGGWNKESQWDICKQTAEVIPRHFWINPWHRTQRLITNEESQMEHLTLQTQTRKILNKVVKGIARVQCYHWFSDK